VSALEKCCSGMADRCDDLMGKYESMLRRTTQVEVSVGLMRSRFETYLLNSGSSTRLYGMRLKAALYNGAIRGQPVDSHMIICHTSVTCERHSHVCIYTT